jgi:hypothetical protein
MSAQYDMQAQNNLIKQEQLYNQQQYLQDQAKQQAEVNSYQGQGVSSQQISPGLHMMNSIQKSHS